MTDTFGRLHPAIQHHVVNSLGWRSLRPLQLAAIGPLLDGEHAVLVAPTAGGKTEAAVLPLLSRMLTEDWRGMSVLYVCPLRALLNNLAPRLEGYGRLVGRRVVVWHGDVDASARRAVLDDPPDVLLTTPESLEAMLISTGVDHARLFADLRAVVVDEAHAFAGDDRGWHLLAVLARVTRLAGRELQRVALSATVGNPTELLGWLTTGCSGPGQVVQPPVDVLAPQPELTVDFVGTLANAALVISRLHRGEKRLVFVDSRARAEHLAAALRGHRVQTWVSHSSLGRDERRRAEQAFAEASDCVIVATSTLELGIDVGDLDRVIQIDAPGTVASLLQRLGRTGRRAGSARSMLFLATSADALVQTVGLLTCFADGYVEPVVPPPAPLHLVAQQCLAVVLQEHGVGRRVWVEWLGTPFALGSSAAGFADEITDHLVRRGLLFDDGGLLGVGQKGEEELGRRHFMELTSVFSSPPVFSVRHGRDEIGTVPDQVLQLRPAGGALVLLLAGRSWAVNHVDWRRRRIYVEPTEARGAARWMGSPRPLGARIARGIRSVLAGSSPSGVVLSRRAVEVLAQERSLHPWVVDGATTLVRTSDHTRWFTFAGLLANTWLAEGLAPLRRETQAIDNLFVELDPAVDLAKVRQALASLDLDQLTLADHVADEAIEGLKFSACLPLALARDVVVRRLDDRVNAQATVDEPLSSSTA